MMTLGPRLLNYVTSNGRTGEISIQVSLEGSSPMYIGEDCVNFVGGSVTIDSDLFSRKISVKGEDDLQLLMRLLWLSDIFIQKVCRDNNVQVYKHERGDISHDLEVYRP